MPLKLIGLYSLAEYNGCHNCELSVPHRNAYPTNSLQSDARARQLKRHDSVALNTLPRTRSAFETSEERPDLLGQLYRHFAVSSLCVETRRDERLLSILEPIVHCLEHMLVFRNCRDGDVLLYLKRNFH